MVLLNDTKNGCTIKPIVTEVQLFSIKNAVAKPEQYTVEDILPDKIPAADATQSSCPPQNCPFQHSRGRESTSLEGQVSQSETCLLWLVRVLLVSWFGFYFFFFLRVSVSYLKKYISCNSLKLSVNAVLE